MPVIEIFLRRNFLLHFQHFLFQPILALQEGKSNSFWTRLWREGSEGSEGKVDGAFGPEGCIKGLYSLALRGQQRLRR